MNFLLSVIKIHWARLRGKWVNKQHLYLITKARRLKKIQNKTVQEQQIYFLSMSALQRDKFPGNLSHCGVDYAHQHWMENANITFSQTVFLFGCMGDLLQFPCNDVLFMKDSGVFLAGCPTRVLCSLLIPDVSLWTWCAMWRRKVYDLERFIFPSYSPSAVFQYRG